jgi:hypothetical protein
LRCCSSVSVLLRHRPRLAVSRRVDVDGVRVRRARVDAQHQAVHLEAVGLDAGQQLVFDSARAQHALQFGLQRHVVRCVVAEAPLPREQAARLQGLRFGGEAVDRGRAVRQRDAAAPLLAPCVQQHELVRLVLHGDVAIGRLAEETFARDRVQPAVHRDDAAVQRRAVAQQFAAVVEHGVIAQVPSEGRGQHLARGLHVVAERVAPLHRHVDAVGEVFAHGAGAVERRAPQAVRAEVQLGRMPTLPQRPLGHDVQRAAGLAAAVQRGSGALEELDALHAGQIPRGVETAPRGHAVEQRGHADVLVARQAADGDVVPQAAEVVLTRDAADIVEDIVQLGRTEVVDGLARDDAHRLRQLAQWQLRLGTGRVVGVVRAGLTPADHFDGGRRRLGRMGLRLGGAANTEGGQNQRALMAHTRGQPAVDEGGHEEGTR